MPFDQIPLTIAIISTIATFGLLIFSWRRRSVRGGMPFLILVAVFLIRAIVLILEEPAFAEKNFDLFFALGRINGWTELTTKVILAWFILRLSHNDRWLNRKLAAILTSTVITYGILLTFRSEWLGTFSDFDQITGEFFYESKPLNYVFIGEDVLCIVTSLFAATHWAIRSSGTWRKQAIMCLITSIISIASLLFFLPPFQANLEFQSFLSAFVPIALLSIAFFRYGLLARLPFYRSIVFQQMIDLGIIIDDEDRIIDLNPVATQIFNVSEYHAIGKPISQLLPQIETEIDLRDQKFRITVEELKDGKLIRLTEIKIDLDLSELGLTHADLRYESPNFFTSAEYLGNQIFKWTTIGYGDVEDVRRALEIGDRIYDAFTSRGLLAHHLVDLSTTVRYTSDGRKQMLDKLREWGDRPGGMAAIYGTNALLNTLLKTAKLLSPNLNIDFFSTEAKALSAIQQISQSQRRIENPKFIEMWRENCETIQIGDRILKVIRDPNWNHVPEDGHCRIEITLIEAKTLLLKIFGSPTAEDPDAHIPVTNAIFEQLDSSERYRIFDVSNMALPKIDLRKRTAEDLNEVAPDLIIIVVSSLAMRTVAIIFSTLLSPLIRHRVKICKT